MKTLKATFALTALSLLFAFTPDQKANYEEAVKKGVEQLYAAESVEEMQTAANTFHRIAQQESNEWLPPYYEALTYTFMSFNNNLEDDQRDFYADKAQEIFESLEGKKPDASEATTLQGFIKMAKLSISPMLRGPFMSGAATALFEKAVKLNPENPRALGMLARMKYGTASFFGSSTEECCNMAQQAVALYQKEKETDRGIMPTWGYKMTKGLADSCSDEG